MATRAELYTALKNADAAGDNEGAAKLAKYIQSMPDDASPAPTAAPVDNSVIGQGIQGGKNLLGGLIRGAGSIGATAMRVLPNALGGDTADENAQRRTRLDENARNLIGSDTNSLLYKGGQLAGEVAGTAGAGGLVANGLRAIPVIARTAAPLIDAISSSGMTAGGLAGKTGLAVRAAGGAVSGGLQAGMVNPEDAGAGAVIGGAAPGVLQLAGKAGNVLGKIINGPAQTPEALAAIQAARDAGYVIPPTQAKPTLLNRVMEGVSGKLTTAQNASAKNAEVTNGLAAKALGLPADMPITVDSLQALRKDAGQSYAALNGAGTIKPSQSYFDALDKIAEPHAVASAGFPNAKPSPVLDMVDSLKSPEFDASAAVAKIKELRSASDDAFRTGNTDVGRASKKAANALESAVEDHLSQTGQTDLLKNFQDARTLIAKSYSVEKALNPTTGTVDAQKLSQQLKKGKPLSDELLQAADFGSRFPKAAQTPEKMGSLPGTSPLDWAAGGISAAAGLHNPLALAGVVARPALRALSLSGVVQNNLATPAGSNALSRLMANPALQQIPYRLAPEAATNPGR